MQKEQINPVLILLIEDNAGDARLSMEAMKESKLNNQVFWVKDGIEAMEYLRKQGKYKNAIRPDLILLDLNLPGKDGKEILEEIKNDSDLKRIPVVILTISKSEEDIFKSYNLHANCYITKPIDFNEFMDVVKSIENFWFTIVSLPNNKNY
ncbi:MAG: response regulator [Bacteroidota bacterium]|nr:response regulator [Bacteroidota bacterium]